MEGSYWFPVTFDDADFMCIKCRMAKTTLELEQQYSNPATCINCFANCQDQFRMSDPTNSARKSVLAMAMRLRVVFKETGIDHVDISQDFQGWLVFAASSLVANATLGTRGEAPMKSNSCRSSPSTRNSQKWERAPIWNLSGAHGASDDGQDDPSFPRQQRLRKCGVQGLLGAGRSSRPG